MLALTIASILALNATFSAEDHSIKKEVDTYLTTKGWPEVFKTTRSWIKLSQFQQARIVRVLLKQLGNRQYVGLQNPADTIILYRWDTGDLKFQGHGWNVRQDLFLSGGRAAWALSEMYDLDNIPELNGGLSKDEWDKRAKDIATYLTPHSLKLRKQVGAYLNTTDWPELRKFIDAWANLPKQDRIHIAMILVVNVHQREEVELTNTGDLVILYRLSTGDLKIPNDEGTFLQQDLYTVGGRAAWALEHLLKVKELPELNAGMTEQEWVKREKIIMERIEKEMK